MRTYLQSKSGHLSMSCNCGIEKPLAEFVDAAVRPSGIGSINLLRLTEWIGRFTSEHAACPDHVPEPAPSGAGNPKP